MKKPSTKKPSNSLPPLTYGTPDVRIPLRRRFWRTVFHGKGLAILLSVGIPLLAIAGYIGYNQYTYQAEKTAYAQLDTDMTTLRDKLQAASPEKVTWEKVTNCENRAQYIAIFESIPWRCKNEIGAVVPGSEVDALLPVYRSLFREQDFLKYDDKNEDFLGKATALKQKDNFYTKQGNIPCSANYSYSQTESSINVSCGGVATKDRWYPRDPDNSF